MIVLYSLISLVIGFCLDVLFGDPEWLPHPIRWIGKWIAFCEKLLRPRFPKTVWGQRWAGVCLVLLVTVVSTGLPLGLLVLCYWCHWAVGIGVESILCYQMIAAHCLGKESRQVAQVLRTKGLSAAQKQVGRIVGRDTQRLDEEGVLKATVETVAENTSDGIIAPLFFMALGGAPLGFFYKSVNTMDSMVGYRNDRYRYFGTAAARLDDILNWIPARISALLMILGAFLLGYDGKGAFRIWKRDRYNHSSPNSAQTEAACAGALQVQLAGDAWYFGVLHRKKTIGDAIRPLRISDVHRANCCMWMTSVLMMACVVAVKLPLSFLVW